MHESQLIVFCIHFALFVIPVLSTFDCPDSACNPCLANEIHLISVGVAACSSLDGCTTRQCCGDLAFISCLVTDSPTPSPSQSPSRFPIQGPTVDISAPSGADPGVIAAVSISSIGLVGLTGCLVCWRYRKNSSHASELPENSQTRTRRIGWFSKLYGRTITSSWISDDTDSTWAPSSPLSVFRTKKRKPEFNDHEQSQESADNMQDTKKRKGSKNLSRQMMRLSFWKSGRAKQDPAVAKKILEKPVEQIDRPPGISKLRVFELNAFWGRLQEKEDITSSEPKKGRVKVTNAVPELDIESEI